MSFDQYAKLGVADHGKREAVSATVRRDCAGRHCLIISRLESETSILLEIYDYASMDMPNTCSVLDFSETGLAGSRDQDVLSLRQAHASQVISSNVGLSTCLTDLSKCLSCSVLRGSATVFGISPACARSRQCPRIPLELPRSP